MFQAVLSGDQDSSDWVRLALPYIIRFVGPIISNFQKLLLALVIPFNLVCVDIARGILLQDGGTLQLCLYYSYEGARDS